MTGRHSWHRVCTVKSKAVAYACRRSPAVRPRGHSSDVSGMPVAEGNWRAPGPLGAEGSVVALLACPRDSEICQCLDVPSYVVSQSLGIHVSYRWILLPFSTLHVGTLAKQRLQSILGHLPIRKEKKGASPGLPLALRLWTSLTPPGLYSASACLVQVESRVQGHSFGI